VSTELLTNRRGKTSVEWEKEKPRRNAGVEASRHNSLDNGQLSIHHCQLIRAPTRTRISSGMANADQIAQFRSKLIPGFPPVQFSSALRVQSAHSRDENRGSSLPCSVLDPHSEHEREVVNGRHGESNEDRPTSRHASRTKVDPGATSTEKDSVASSSACYYIPPGF